LDPEWPNAGPEYHSKVAGATLIAEALSDLKILRMALTESK
jgi:hypothetical protein